MEDTVVTALNLRKSWGETVALDGLSFDVFRGEVFGLVGPNGAGKTTTIDCISGMTPLDSGQLATLGLDPSRNTRRLHRMIGLQQQESELPDRIRVREAVELFAGLYSAEVDASELLGKVGLLSKVDSYFSNLSGGQKRRLFVALAMVNDPELVLLDELTSGLDPAGRRKLWKLVREFRGSGRTVILSTHYMDEAMHLCDRVAIINNGSAVAVDTPEALIGKYCPGLRLELGCSGSPDLNMLKSLNGVTGVEISAQRYTLDLSSSEYVIPVLKTLFDAGETLEDLHTQRPTLEDVFMRITGSEYTDDQ